MLIVTESPSVVLLPNQAAIPQLPSKKDIRLEAGDFVARLALTEEERMAAYRLRFLVFNLEMNEGLESAFVDGYDKDHFDDVCDHLIVEDRKKGAVVGTYRMQMGDIAGQYFGYYSEQEFCFAPYESMRSQIVELGRACIHRDCAICAGQWSALHDGLLLVDVTGPGDRACCVRDAARLHG
jgi:putative hemolysin